MQYPQVVYKKTKKGVRKMCKSYRRMIGIVVGVSVLIVTATYTGIIPSSTKTPVENRINFNDPALQAKEFITYNSIALSPAQEKIKNEALSSIPAPCCGDHQISTCCCPCNLAKSVWGLSNLLVAERNYSAEEVKSTVLEWIKFTNEDGYAGNACYRGRCNLPFREDGCGGMGETTIF